MSQAKPTRYRHPNSKPAPGKLPGAIRCGEWIHVSGQGPLQVGTGNYLPGTVEDETLRTLDHIEKILQQAGADRRDVIKCTCYLADLDKFAEFHAAFVGFFGEDIPCRTTVRADLLRGIQVEIDAVAYSPEPKQF